MRYSEAVATAPPGCDSFQAGDICRLSATTLALLFRAGAAAPPLGDVALALGVEPRILSVLGPASAADLKRLAEAPAPEPEREAARKRLVRGEGERTFRDLLAALGRGADPAGIPGLSYRRAAGDGFTHPPARPVMPPLRYCPSTATTVLARGWVMHALHL